MIKKLNFKPPCFILGNVDYYHYLFVGLFMAAMLWQLDLHLSMQSLPTTI